jgi:hypothetical protein
LVIEVLPNVRNQAELLSRTAEKGWCFSLGGGGGGVGLASHCKSNFVMQSYTGDVQSFRAADCDTDHYLVVAKVRERLAVNEQRSHRFHMNADHVAPSIRQSWH